VGDRVLEVQPQKTPKVSQKSAAFRLSGTCGTDQRTDRRSWWMDAMDAMDAMDGMDWMDAMDAVGVQCDGQGVGPVSGTEESVSAWNLRKVGVRSESLLG